MTNDQLLEWVRAATSGDRAAAERLLVAVKDAIYRLALRMLGHAEDAEDATQEILVVVLTQLASFRGESAFQTWVFRIAANHLMRVRKGRRETMSFEAQSELLEAGLSHEHAESTEQEDAVLVREVRLRCTQAMMLSLDRETRLAYLLSDVFELSGDEAARVLEVDPATYRKRVSRARTRLLEFLSARCGLFDPNNACRCEKQIPAALERGLLRRDALLFAEHPAASSPARLDEYAEHVSELERAAAIVRHPDYQSTTIVQKMRELLDSGRLKVLN